MKKAITILFALFIIWSLAACGNSVSQTGQSSTDGNPIESNANTENSNTDDMESTDALEIQLEEEDASGIQESKVLVAYFSATNTTEGVAEHIANALNADIYEINPEEPYTDADLNYSDNNSRTTIEMNDPNARPSISGSVENMEQYTVVFIGYPIWWGQAPKIMYTFVEHYNLSGKTVIPFCTSASSEIGTSATNLQAADTSQAIWLTGRRFSGSSSESDVVSWLDELELQ
ncbi:MAG: NAD(P)H-dependent oxidoreductase [Lachnospiraceae bacterium]|nr:NAD(P)H-dependent oxidoreductase [Lachnospiraceae bacterium]